MNKITLGVHLIVKNEADLLPRCLESLAGADEIVVTDTGSGDETRSIARSYGARLYELAWNDDFSAARNHGLAQAATDWILVMDADEVLLTPMADLTALLQTASAQAFTVSIDNRLGPNPEDHLSHRAVRLFRNGQGYRYSGIIHEAVDESIMGRHGAGAIESSDIVLLHDGYLPEIMARKQKTTRNKKLLQLALEQQPDDPFHLYNMAVTCCQEGQLQEAEELLVQSIRQASLRVSYRPTMIRDLCKLYLSGNKLQQLDSLLVHELERYPDYPDLHMLQGQSLELQGLPERAFGAYQRAEVLPEPAKSSGKYVSEHGMYTFRPLHRMGVISQQLGLQEEAARLFHRALSHHPLYRPALLGISSTFQRLEVADDAVAALLIQLTGTDSPAARAAIAETLCDIEAYGALAELSNGILPPEPGTALPTLSAMIISGRLQQADALMAELTVTQATEQEQSSGYPEACWTAWALCQWELYGSLQNSLFTAMPEALCTHLRAVALHLDERKEVLLHSEEVVVEPAASLPLPPSLITSLVRQSVRLKCSSIGQRLVQRFPAYSGVRAAAFYEQGDLQAAGELWITLLQEGRAEGPILFYIGETLYDYGHYDEAVRWFRQALEEEAKPEAARTGLALCYLHQALQELAEAGTKLESTAVEGPLQEDIKAVQSAITLLNHTPWHTEWSFRSKQRRETS
ncbi:glycosyltransferase [Paenibacillus donghaensis]|uniref:glycosyltransferase n=1 Tax=Paenibacillus donghaensis TaxID=414771 RepID=UPI0012FDBB0C|nr:glycosyltransferase [Paenibacillus donghaensis]